MLPESEATFGELADTAPVMMWTTDERGLVTFVNAGWLRFTGTTFEEDLGETWTLGVHPRRLRRGAVDLARGVRRAAPLGE